MKRNLRIAIFVLICSFLLLPIAAWAESYDLGGTDMTIEIDDSRWYVFTRDNLENNPELAEFGMSESEVYDDLCSLDAYMDALLLYTDGTLVELFVIKTSLSEGDPVNMSNYSNEELEEVAKSLADEHGVDDYSVYENDYKFLRFDYLEEESDHYIYAFVTVVNREVYTLNIQSTAPFTDAEYEEFDRIVDSIHFDVDTSMKEPETSSGWGAVAVYAVTGAVIGGISALIGASRKKNNRNNPYPPQNPNGYYQQDNGGYYQQNSNGYYQPGGKR